MKNKEGRDKASTSKQRWKLGIKVTPSSKCLEIITRRLSYDDGPIQEPVSLPARASSHRNMRSRAQDHVGGAKINDNIYLYIM